MLVFLRTTLKSFDIFYKKLWNSSKWGNIALLFLLPSDRYSTASNILRSIHISVEIWWVICILNSLVTTKTASIVIVVVECVPTLALIEVIVPLFAGLKFVVTTVLHNLSSLSNSNCCTIYIIWITSSSALLIWETLKAFLPLMNSQRCIH